MAKVDKNQNLNNGIKVKEGIIIVVVIFVIIAIVYLLTMGAQKLGWFDLGYTKPEVESAVISYENILAGSIFNKQSGEYYVMIADYDNDSSIYVSSLGSLYNEKENKINLYAVNLGEGLNKSIMGEKSNVAAQDVSNLSVSGPTLIKIRDGRNIRYIEGEENIKLELGV